MKIILTCLLFLFCGFLEADDRLINCYIINLSSFPTLDDNVGTAQLMSLGKSFDNNQPARVTRIVQTGGNPKYAYLYISTNTSIQGNLLDSLENRGYIYKHAQTEIREYTDTNTGRFTRTAETRVIKTVPADFYTFFVEKSTP